MKRNRKTILVAWLLGTIAFSLPASAAGLEETIEDEYRGCVEAPDSVESIYNDVNYLQGSEEIPVYYDAREYGQVTSVKNQNPWGTCWSFSAMAALEGSLLSQGLYEDIDLSEYHFINYCSQWVEDPLGGTAEDSLQYDGTMSEFLQNGGNILVSYHALTNWIGAVEESFAPYPTEGAAKLAVSTDHAYLNDVVHVQQVYKINKQDVPVLKEAIMEYGGVSASIYYKNTYLNEKNGAYYNSYYTNCNHAITIIGWDDNYSKDNFTITPDTDGAWLVKNSWGTDFGQDGYLWVSYEDRSLQEGMCVLVGEKADNYDNNYQYDGSYMNSYLSSDEVMTVANVFQIQEGETKEALQAVSFETGSTNVEYSIQIYSQPTDAADPTSGKARLEQPVTGITSFEGYYTVRLPEEILLNPGEKFAVVVTLCREENVRIVLETSRVWNDITFVAGAEEGQSFFQRGSDADGQWKDVGSIYGKNIRIKAFTDNTEIARDILVEAVETQEALTLEVGEETQLNAVVYPENATNQKVSFSSADSEIAEVDADGKVTAKKKGTTLITCTTEDGDFTADTEITVRNAIELKAEAQELAVGDSFAVTIYLNGEAQTAELNRGYTWSVDNEEVVTVTEDGTVTGCGMGTAVISCVNREDETESASVIVQVRIPFRDISRLDWQYPYVVYVYENHIMSGKSAELFDMNNTLRRSEFVTVLYNAAGKPKIAYEQQFSDVKESDWFAASVTWAKEKKITAGYGSGAFGVADNITREQLVKMLYEYAKLFGNVEASGQGALSSLAGSGESDSQEALGAFADYGEVSTWAVEAMEWAVEHQIISGKPLEEGKLFLDPAGHATRGECAAIMKKYSDMPADQNQS